MSMEANSLGISGRILRVMLGCPGDIEDEVRIFFGEVQRWNEQHGEEYGVMLLPKHWSTHAHPQLGERAQGIINTQLADKADILVAVFWSRLGTETGSAPSGTVEEILRFHESGRPVKLYFSENAILSPAAATDEKFIKEFGRLSKFREQAKELGLYDSFKDGDDFRKKLERHLMLEVRSLRDKGFLHAREQTRNESVVQDKVLSPLRTLRRTVERLRRDWKSEAGSHLSRYDHGKQIMARLSIALGTHLAELSEEYTDDQLEPFESLLLPIKNIEQSPSIMGSEYHRQFWGAGTEIFTNLISAIDSLGAPDER